MRYKVQECKVSLIKKQIVLKFHGLDFLDIKFVENVNFNIYFVHYFWALKMAIFKTVV